MLLKLALKEFVKTQNTLPRAFSNRDIQNSNSTPPTIELSIYIYIYILGYNLKPPTPKKKEKEKKTSIENGEAITNSESIDFIWYKITK